MYNEWRGDVDGDGVDDDGVDGDGCRLLLV